MDITPLVPEGKKIIKSYSDTGFKICNDNYNSNIIIFPTSVHDWNITQDEEIDLKHLYIFLDNEIDIILIGSGKKQKKLDPSIIHKFQSQGINIDIMNTGAACRTFNILLSEERRVAAALMIG